MHYTYWRCSESWELLTQKTVVVTIAIQTIHTHTNIHSLIPVTNGRTRYKPHNKPQIRRDNIQAIFLTYFRFVSLEYCELKNCWKSFFKKFFSTRFNSLSQPEKSVLFYSTAGNRIRLACWIMRWWYILERERYESDVSSSLGYADSN